jgi:hypothetical protein
MATEVITAYSDIPYSVIGSVISGSLKSDFLNELGEVKKLYEVYRKGVDFTTEGAGGDYVPSKLKFKKAKSLVNKEVRFLFGNTPDFKITCLEPEQKEQASIYQNLVDAVLKKNNISKKLLQASKDCFVGKRVACVLNFNDLTGIKISFLSSLEFYYETDTYDSDQMIKFVMFPRVVQSANKSEERIFKKTYSIDDTSGLCYVEEILYDGSGKEIEVVTPLQATEFEFIPAVIITNDGLLGDIRGESEVEQLMEYEENYSKLSNSDIDSERKSMHPIRYAIDADPNTTGELSSSPGSFWDIASDKDTSDGVTAQVGILESTMSYKDALKYTLDRINNTMYEEIDMPNVSPEALKGVVSSGKTLKAIYWGLIVRCDEKMKTWGPALEFVASTIIEGARLYPTSASYYITDKLPDVEYEVKVENNYALPEDETEEKTADILEVTSQVRSRKSYLKKWGGLTDEEADEELKQIAKERELIDDSFMSPTNGLTDGGDISASQQDSKSSSEDQTQPGEDVNNKV